jgi:RNA polymerase sigma-70 factor (ECF subfamily)
MTMTRFQDLLVEQLPKLRIYARFLARDRTLADDLVQETVLQALTYSQQFTPGTNLKAWLSTILRNRFLNELRSRSRLADYAAMPKPERHTIDQEIRLELRDLERAFRSLPEAQSEALWLVGAGGFSYQDAAKIVGCPEGTVKSRANRGRVELDRRLAGEPSTTPPARVPERTAMSDRAVSRSPRVSSLLPA